MAIKRASKKQNRIQRFTRETVGELKKVSWPTPKEARHLTGIVIVVVVIMAFYLGIVVDGLAGRLLNLMLGV
ncbi:MAG: preprotein translocase subunit SecE [Anaerolineae bacterium]|nr:preprotein translocase subunit SecE [Anaerolineae bacterium]